MYFKVEEVWDYELQKYIFNLYREQALLHANIDTNGIEKFVMDRACLFDTDIIEYSWRTDGLMSGLEARLILTNAARAAFVSWGMT